MVQQGDFVAMELPGAVKALPRGHRRALTALAGVVVGWAAFNVFYSLGDHPLYSPSEARYARVSQVMLESGDWLLPRFEGEVRLAKPPLVHWMQCAAMTVMGQTEWAVRLPSALATLVAAGAAWWFMRRRRDAITAVMAATIMLILPLTLAVGRTGLIDPLLNAFWCWAVVLGFEACAAGGKREGGKPQAAYAAGFWLMVGLAVLAKGPVGGMPVLIVVVWLIVSGRSRALWHWHWPVGLIASALPLGAWAWAVYQQHPEAAATWYTETIARVDGSGSHPQAWWYYLPIVLAGFFPATAMLPLPGWTVRWSRIGPAMREGHAMGYMALAVVVPIVVFSMMVGKLWTYVLPCGMPLACIAAWWLRPWLDVTDDSRSIDRAHPAKRLPNGTGTIAAAMTVVLIGAAAVVGVPTLRAKIGLNEEFDATLLKMILQAALVPAMLWVAWKLWRRADRRPWAIALSGLAFTIAGLFTLTIEDAAMKTRGAPEMLKAIDDAIDGDYVLTTVGDRDPSLSFYAGYHVARQGVVENFAIDAPDRLAALAGPEGGRWVIVSFDGRWDEIAERAPAFAKRFDELLDWQRPFSRQRVVVERPVVQP